MLGSRRPREVYRVYDEDELLEDATAEARSGTQEHADAAHRSDDEPVVAPNPKPISRSGGGEWVGDWPRHDYGGESWRRRARGRRLATTLLGAAAGLAVGLGAVTLIERALSGRRAAAAPAVAGTGTGTIATRSPQAVRPRRSYWHPARSRAALVARTRGGSVQRRGSAAPLGTAPDIYAVAYDQLALGPAPTAAAAPQSEQTGFGPDEADAEFGFER